MGHKFHILDVFTDQAYGGNQLAIVEDADDLDVFQMQAITREFGFSETVFLQLSENPTAAAKVRIFTPAQEIPFAGHPTIGTAVLLGERKSALSGNSQNALLVFDGGLGPVRCGVSMSSAKATYAEFDTPKLPEKIDTVPETDLVADALGVSLMDVGFENHKVSSAHMGIKYVFVPLKSIQIVRAAAPDFAHWDAAFPSSDPLGVYVYCRDGVMDKTGFHARMFAPTFGVPEDPATGSAAAGFAHVIERFEIDGQQTYETYIEQGYEMGRPSCIKLEVEFANRKMRTVRVGGQAVLVASGELL